jgi:hypothetical protein
LGPAGCFDTIHVVSLGSAILGNGRSHKAKSLESGFQRRAKSQAMSLMMNVVVRGALDWIFKDAELSGMVCSKEYNQLVLYLVNYVASAGDLLDATTTRKSKKPA